MGGGFEFVARAGRGGIDNAVEPQVPLEQRDGLFGKADGVVPGSPGLFGTADALLISSMSPSRGVVQMSGYDGGRARGDETTHPRAYPPSRR